MIKDFFEAMRSNILYTVVVLAIISLFGYENYYGTRFIGNGGVQKNAGYHGVVPHSGYGVRFYHK